MSPGFDDLVIRLGWVLLHFIWQGALIGVFCAAALVPLRDARPQTRYALCATALLLCLLLPLGQLLIPSSGGSIVLRIHASSGGGMANPQALSALGDGGLHAGLLAVVVLWTLGAGLMLLRLLAGWIWVQRLSVRAHALVEGDWPQRLAELAARMGLRRVPELRLLEDLDGPITVGRWRPLILLPASLLTRLPPDLIEALLAHELAHVRRWDYLANLLQGLVEALLFYHPVVWWLSRRLRIEREQIADDLAAQALGEPHRLARALSALADVRSQPNPLALAAQGGLLMSRIERLLRPTRSPLGWKPLLPLAVLAVLAAAAQAAGLTAAPQPPQPVQAAVPASAVKPATQVKAQTITVREPSRSITLRERSQPFAFAILWGEGDGIVMSGSDADLREAKALQRKQGHDFLWARDGKQRYVLTDAGALAELRALWAAADAFDPEIERIGKQVEAQSERVEREARDFEAANAKAHADLAPLHKQLAALHKQRAKADLEISKVQRQLDATRDGKRQDRLEQQVEKLEKALEPLDQQIEALEAKIDHRTDALDQALSQAQSKRDTQAERELEKASREMEAIGRQQEEAAKAAEQKTRALIQDYVRRGLAKAV